MQISFGLSAKEVNDAIKEIKAYQKTLDYKVRLYVDRLAEIGLKTASANISSGSVQSGTESAYMEHGKRVNVFIEGKLVLFIEFGSGITYNKGKENPKAKEMGYGVGTYPEQTHAFDPEGWYYLGEDGNYHHSYGIEATMPMYKASKEIKEQMLSIAKEVFGS